MVDKSAKESRHWRGGEEEHLVAAIIPSSETRLAFAAYDIWFDGDSVAGFEVCY